MGELEDLGMLRHLHTSAGRIPTDRGLRYYVDTLLRVRSLSAPEQEEIRERLGPASEPAGDHAKGVARAARRSVPICAVVVQAPRGPSRTRCRTSSSCACATIAAGCHRFAQAVRSRTSSSP